MYQLRWAHRLFRTVVKLLVGSDRPQRRPRPSATRIGNHNLKPSTLMMGYGFDPALSEGSLKPPIFLTSTFVFDSAAAGKVESGFLVGGLTSSRGRNLQVADGLVEGGMSGVAFADSITVATRLTQGCSPVGPKHEITSSQHNVIITLDGRPALEVFKEDIGEQLSRDLNRIGGHIFAGLPIKGSDTGDYLVRNLVGIDPGNGLIAIGELVQTGASVMFCKRDSKTANEDMTRMLESIKQGMFARPRGGVYYSCLGRGASLFGPNSEELKMIREALGDFPLVGFFCNGEISHNRLYGYTGVLTLFV